MIIFKHEETDNFHMYSPRNLRMRLLMICPMMIGLFLFLFSPNNSVRLAGGFVILINALVVAIDTSPMVIRQLKASAIGAKTIKFSGSFWNRRIEIQK